MNATRSAIESLYVGICTVTEWQDIKDPITHITSKQEVTVIINQPCRLSYSSVPSTTQTDGPAIVTQSIKLFIAPEIEIKSGSQLTITQNGRTEDYCRSGQPAYYSNHQEIPLELFKEYS